VYLPLGPLALHPHAVFESLAYFVGFRLYLWMRSARGDAIADRHRWAVIAAATLGAAAGSKLISLASDPWATATQVTNLRYLIGGKSIAGGLIGGLVAVELVKHWLGVKRATGDLFAVPLAVGIAVGRVGCFLTGLEDETHGLPTPVPWGIDFGDGIPRHPTQFYEIAFLALFTVMLWWLLRRPHVEGDVFKLFMVGYLGFRLWLEFLKPGVALAGLNAIQWACGATLLYYACHFARRQAPRFSRERWGGVRVQPRLPRSGETAHG
jgi:prolipoprotein diacylglyceryltransferase